MPNSTIEKVAPATSVVAITFGFTYPSPFGIISVT